MEIVLALLGVAALLVVLVVRHKDGPAAGHSAAGPSAYPPEGDEDAGATGA